MRTLQVLLVLAVLMTTAWPATAKTQAAPFTEIVIIGDVGPTGFVLAMHPLTHEPIYRPGSGVTAGRGTAEDPYVIDAPSVSRIHLAQTRAHVMIRQANVASANARPLDAAGIRLEDAQHVRVEHSSVVGLPAIVIERSANVSVVGSTLASAEEDGELIVALDSTDVLVHANAFRKTWDHAFSGKQLARVDLAGNSFVGVAAASPAYWVEGSRDVTIRDHDALGPVSIVDTNATTYSNNHADVAGLPAISMWGSFATTIRDAVLTGDDGAIALRYGGDAHIDNVTATISGPWGNTIDCYWTPAVTISRTRVSSEWGQSLVAQGCDSLQVSSSVLAGIWWDTASDLRISDTDISSGALLSGSDVTLRTSTLHDAYWTFVEGNNVTLVENEFRSVYEGIDIDSGPGSRIEDNAFLDMPRTALHVIGSEGTRIDGNTFHNVSREITIDGSTDLTIDNHTLARGLVINAYGRGHLRHELGPNNLVAGRPIRLLHNVSDVTVEPGYAQLFLSESRNVTIVEPDLHNVSRAITTMFTTGVTIQGGSIVDSGIAIDSSDDAAMLVRDTSFARNGVGAWVWAAHDLTLDGTSFVQSGHAGLIDLWGSDSTLTLRDAEVADSKGFGLWAQSGRLDVSASSFTGNGHDPAWSWRDFGFPGDPGILTSSENVSITGSRFVDNDLGLWTMRGGDATRNHWGCAEGPGADGCDDTASWNVPHVLDPWCQNDVFLDRWCEERSEATAASPFGIPATSDATERSAPTFSRSGRAPGGDCSSASPTRAGCWGSADACSRKLLIGTPSVQGRPVCADATGPLVRSRVAPAIGPSPAPMLRAHAAVDGILGGTWSNLDHESPLVERRERAAPR